MLQGAAMKFVSRPQVLTKKPRAIRGYVIHGVELIAHEGRARQRDAFLRQLGASRVHAFEGWRQPAQDGEITSHVSGARCAGSAARRMCNNVVPLRGKPTMNNGSRIVSCAISG